MQKKKKAYVDTGIKGCRENYFSLSFQPILCLGLIIAYNKYFVTAYFQMKMLQV